MADPFMMAEDDRRAPLPADVEAALAAGVPVEPVSSEQAARIRRKIGEALDFAPGSATHRLDEGQWIRRSADCEIKILNHDRATGVYSYLLRLGPAGTIAPHSHRQAEECLILSGEIEVGGVTLKAGDYQAFAPGTAHTRIVSRTGALVFIRAELQLAA